jgi:replicative DNA helicase
MSALSSADKLYSEATERAVLAACIADGRRVIDVRDIVAPDDFYLLRHRHILDAMFSLQARDSAVDMMTIADELKRRGLLDEIGGGAYLNQLLGAAVNVSGVEDHARVVANYAKRLRLVQAAAKMQKDALDLELDMEMLRGRIETTVTDLDDKTIESEPVGMEAGIRDYFQKVQATRGMLAGVSGLATGYKAFDELLDGLRGLAIVAGRPAMGKSAFALGVALNVSKCAPVYIASMEMSRDEIYARIYASECDIDPASQRRGLREGGMNMAQWERFKEATGTLSHYPIYIDDIDICSPAWVVRRVERMIRRGKRPSLIILDYLQLMESGDKNKVREQEISAIARGLKRATKRLKIPILALAQINRMVEGRAEKRPVMSDLRESGEIEQAADTVTFIYRDVVYNEMTEFPNRADLIIAKNRHGASGTVSLHFDASRTKFSDAKTQTIDLGRL